MMQYGNTWDVAIHEAAHLLAFVKVGGKPSHIQQVCISPTSGHIRPTKTMFNYHYGILLDAVVTAAGIACEQIRGLPPCTGRGSDTEILSNTLVSTPQDEMLVVDKTRQWLQSKWDLVEWTANELIAAPKRKGVVSRTEVKRIVSELQHRLPQRKLRSR